MISCYTSHQDLLSQLSFKYQAEALLRCVFRSLDHADSGYVSVTLLLKCLGQDEDEEHDEYKEQERERKGKGEEEGREHGQESVGDRKYSDNCNDDDDDCYGAGRDRRKIDEEEEVEANQHKHRIVGINRNNGSPGEIASSSSRIQNSSDVINNYNRNNYDNVIHEKNYTDNKRDYRREEKKNTGNEFNRTASNIGNEVILPHTDTGEDSLPRIVCVSMGPVLFCRLIKELKKTVERAKVTRYHATWHMSNKPSTEVEKDVRKEVEKRFGEEEGIEVKLSWGEVRNSGMSFSFSLFTSTATRCQTIRTCILAYVIYMDTCMCTHTYHIAL